MSDSPKPTYLTIANAIKSQIASGDVDSGDKLPSINEIAAEWGVSRSMVSRALTYLEDEGYVTTIQGKGTFVATPDTMPREKSNRWKIFWSYAHKDDQNSGGGITRLREAIQAEYELRTGDDDLDIFQDTKDLEWGTDWRKEIDGNLAVTSFFIPILTPTYLRSPHCLAELRSAVGVFERMGYEEGICPIDFVDCSNALKAFQDDEIFKLLDDTQRIVDFKNLRYKGPESSEYREKVAELVDRLMAKREKLQKQQEERERLFTEKEGCEEGDEATEGGDLLVRIAAMQDQLEQLGQLTDLIGADIEAIGNAFSDNPAPANMNPKHAIALAGSIAKKLEAPCQDMEEHCAQYYEMIQAVDDGMDACLEFAAIAESSGFGDGMSANLATLHVSVAALCEKTEEPFGQIDSLRKMITGFSKLSRVLTKPCRRIDIALGKMSSSGIVFEGWERRLREFVG